MPTGLHDVKEHDDAMVHDGGNGVGLHWVCGDVSDGEYGIAPGVQLISGEKWSGACAVEVCAGGGTVDFRAMSGMSWRT